MNAKKRGRRPDPAVDELLGDALLELFRERGVDLTYDEVATRAGVGRATVFRRFPTKRDLILAAASQLVMRQLEVRDTGSFRGDMVALIGEAMDIVSDSRHRMVLRRVHGEAFRDDAIADILRANLAERHDLFRTVVARGIERGEVAPDTDPTLLADLVSGVVVLRLATNTALPDDTQVHQIVDALVRGVINQHDR